MGEGWEYAATSSKKFCPLSKTLKTVRRRKWLRKMVCLNTETSASIFNLESSFVVSDLTLHVTT